MADISKIVAKLVVGPDGRSATNWSCYKMQLENALSDKKTAGFYLDDVLLNKGDAVLTDPGSQCCNVQLIASVEALLGYSVAAVPGSITVA